MYLYYSNGIRIIGLLIWNKNRPKAIKRERLIGLFLMGLGEAH